MPPEFNKLIGQFKSLTTQAGFGSSSGQGQPQGGYPGQQYGQYQPQPQYHPPPQHQGYYPSSPQFPPQFPPQRGYQSPPPGPPPIPQNRPDYPQPPPPQPDYTTKPAEIPAAPTSVSPEGLQWSSKVGDITYGIIYKPGTYPTPELYPFPLGPHKVLTNEPFTSGTIQAALDALGPSTTLYLPRGSKWIISKPLILQLYQELATEGYPTAEKEMATLEASKDLKPYMFECWDKTGIQIRNLIMEGGREKYGWSEHCGVMVSLGHTAHNQQVDRCIIRNPRNWSCIQAFEGGHNIRITNNIIGPGGVGQDVEGHRWADGISLAAQDCLVAGNEVIDCTDGAIVIFGAGGSLITSNVIRTISRLSLGAMNMVDWGWEGNYEGTRVINNTVSIEGSYIKMAYSQGGTCMSDNQPRCINRGCIVMRNLITAPKAEHANKGAIGYGFAVTDVAKWTCLDNRSDPWVRYQADTSHSLPDALVTPGPFVKDYTPVEKLGRLQPEFTTGRVSFIILIKKGPNTVLSFGSGKLKLRHGETIRVRDTELGFDGSLFVRDVKTGRKVWELRAQGCSNPSEVVFHEDGKLYVQDSNSGSWIDLIPALPRFPQKQRRPDFDPRSPFESRLILSALHPPLIIAPCPNPSKMVFYASAYEFPIGTDFGPGHMTFRPQGDHVLLYTVSPFAQWMILRSQMPAAQLQLSADPEAAYGGLINWNVHDGRRMDDPRWSVVWRVPNEPSHKPIYDGEGAPKMCFQGDGNLVLYADGDVKWASGTNGLNPKPCRLRYGDGVSGQGWVELIDEHGKALWHC